MASAIRVKYLLHWTMDVDCRTKIRQKQFGKVTTCKTAQAVQNKLIIITILEVRRVKEVFSHLAQQ